jgi:hypothetical protein
MPKIEKEVQDFMENQMGIYVNLRDVEITTHLDFSVTLAIDFEEEGDEDMSVGVMYLCDTLQEFVAVFNIEALEQIKKIARSDLLKLYSQGKAYMYCTIDGYESFTLYFLKQGGKLAAKTEDDEIHEVAELLESPKGLMDYTREHFRVLKELKEVQRLQHILVNGKNDKDDPGQVGLSLG